MEQTFRIMYGLSSCRIWSWASGTSSSDVVLGHDVRDRSISIRFNFRRCQCCGVRLAPNIKAATLPDMDVDLAHVVSKSETN